jgi:hypothetical protein
MAFNREPKGVYVRQSPDLFSGNCAWGWIAGVGSGNGFEDVGIENLDNAGRTMLVWSVVANIFFPNTTAHPTGRMAIGHIQGHEDASGFGKLTPLNPLSGGFTANVWDTPTGSGIDDSLTIMELLSGPGFIELSPTYPIAVIPTTWSIAAGLSWIVGAASIAWSVAWLVEFVGPNP